MSDSGVLLIATVVQAELDREWAALVQARREAQGNMQAVKTRIANIGAEEGVAKNRKEVKYIKDRLRIANDEYRFTHIKLVHVSAADAVALRREYEEWHAVIKGGRELLDKREQWYQQLQQQLQQQLRLAEEALAIVEEQILLWACQDLARLEWLLAHEPHSRGEALRRYRRQHAGENVSSLGDQVTVLVPAAPTSVRPLRLTELPEVPETSPTVVERPWMVTMVDERLHKVGLVRCELSGRSKRKMDKLLQELDHRSARPGVILKALWRVTQMDTQQRQELNKLVGVVPEGWKIQGAGPFRLLLNVDEERCRIQCLVRRVNEAYDIKRHHV